jgi:hypothetical protein
MCRWPADPRGHLVWIILFCQFHLFLLSQGYGLFRMIPNKVVSDSGSGIFYFLGFGKEEIHQLSDVLR